MPELTFGELQKQVLDLAQEVTRDAEAITRNASRINEEANDTARIGDSIGSMRVDTATVGETSQLSKIMAGLSEASLTYAAKTNDTAKAAQAAKDQNQASHRGIGEAAGRSPVGAAIYDVKREWLTPQ